MANHSALSKQAVVAGAGPVGTLTAIALAKQGWQVQVFDRWPLPSSRPSASDTRAYMLNLNSRALRAFKLFDVEVNPLIAPHGGSIRQAFYNEKGAVVRSFTEAVGYPATRLRIFRDEIARQLIDEAQRLHPDRITFNFGVPIANVDLDKQTVTTSKNTDNLVDYDLLVGADGANSVVRAQLQNAVPNLVRRIRHDVVYSAASVKVPAEELPGHCFFEGHAFEEGAVTWNGRGDGDVRIALFIPAEFADKITAGDPKWIQDRLESGLPSLPQPGKEAILELATSNPQWHPLSSWTHVSQLHGPNTVLLGDAAHTMTPILGQGLNCGLEDVAVFAQTLEQHQGRLDTALPAYNKARWADVEAMVNINEIVANQNLQARPQDRDWRHVMYLRSHALLLQLHVASHSILHKAMPAVFARPKFISMLNGEAPYRSVLSSIYTDAVVFSSILVGTLASLAYCVL